MKKSARYTNKGNGLKHAIMTFRALWTKTNTKDKKKSNEHCVEKKKTWWKKDWRVFVWFVFGSTKTNTKDKKTYQMSIVLRRKKYGEKRIAECSFDLFLGQRKWILNIKKKIKRALCLKKKNIMKKGLPSVCLICFWVTRLGRHPL